MVEFNVITSVRLFYSYRGESSFERVKSGGGQQHSRSAEAPRLALDNKFAALRDH